MSRAQARVLEFQEILGEEKIDLKRLRVLAHSGIPDSQKIRSTCWKLLLDYLPPKRSEWEATLKKKRQQYSDFVKEFVVEGQRPQQAEDVVFDPLGAVAVSGPSPWDIYFKDNEILEQIDKDVHRLCPEFAFYKDTSPNPPPSCPSLHSRVSRENLEASAVKCTRSGLAALTRRPLGSDDDGGSDAGASGEKHWEVVERILFVFAKLNGRFYVQGMNEILGLLYFVFATDAAPEWLPHVEADAFFCFMAIMATPNFRECFFKNVDDTTAGVGARLATLLSKLTMHDPAVSSHLDGLSLRPQFFCFSMDDAALHARPLSSRRDAAVGLALRHRRSHGLCPRHLRGHAHRRPGHHLGGGLCSKHEAAAELPSGRGRGHLHRVC